MKFENKGKWFGESAKRVKEEDLTNDEMLALDEDEDDFSALLAEDELDITDSDEQPMNEVRYIDPDNLDRYDPKEIEEVTTASGEKRYKRKLGDVATDNTPHKSDASEPKDNAIQVSKEELDRISSDVTNKLTEGAKKAYKKYRRFEPSGFGFYSTDFFDMDSIAEDLQKTLPSSLGEDMKLRNYSAAGNQIIYRYGSDDETYAWIKLDCYASPRSGSTKYEINTGKYDVLPNGQLSDEPTSIDTYFGKQLGDGLSQSITKLAKSVATKD